MMEPGSNVWALHLLLEGHEVSHPHLHGVKSLRIVALGMLAARTDNNECDLRIAEAFTFQRVLDLRKGWKLYEGEK